MIYFRCIVSARFGPLMIFLKRWFAYNKIRQEGMHEHDQSHHFRACLYKFIFLGVGKNIADSIRHTSLQVAQTTTKNDTTMIKSAPACLAFENHD